MKEHEDQNKSETEIAFSNNNPVILKEIYPKVKGVIIVAQGGDNVEIKNQYEIRKSISRILALTESKEPAKPLHGKSEPQIVEIDYAMVALALKTAKSLN